MVKGSPKFDGLALGEGSFNFLTATVSLYAKAAFINNATGTTHGWTESRQGWSKETMRALAELRACIERDLGGVHLEGSEVPSETSSSSSTSGAPPGIGEHLKDDGTPQV